MNEASPDYYSLVFSQSLTPKGSGGSVFFEGFLSITVSSNGAGIGSPVGTRECTLLGSFTVVSPSQLCASM